MARPKAHILVVEDDSAMRNGLLEVLVFNGYSANGIEDGQLGLEAALGGDYDLVLLDVMLPTLDGFSICRRIRKQRPGQAVIMLTAKGAEKDIVDGFKSGADDYVSKPFSLRELMVRVEAVLRRSGKALGDEVIQWKKLVFDGRNLHVRCGDRVSVLTRREMDVIVYLHRHQDRIVSKRELLTDVWQYADADIETRTVDIHILKLRKKLNTLGPENGLLETVRGEGYRWSRE